jgi:hypothetical protein
MTTALGRVFRIETEMEQGVAVDGCGHDDVAAVSAIAAAGTAARDILLASEGQTAVPPVTRFDRDFYFVDKHEEVHATSVAFGFTPRNATEVACTGY